MTAQGRRRYEAALRRCRDEVAAINALLAEYPTPKKAADERATLELEDLARRLAALTALWTPFGVEPEYAAAEEGSKTSGDHSHGG